MASIPYKISDWSGGMINVLDSEKLSLHQSEYLENIEYRDGLLRTRRGSFVVQEGVAGETFQGAGIYRSQDLQTIRETRLIAQGGKIYRITLNGDRQAMVLPGTLNLEDEVTFVQGFDKIYIFRGEQKTPWSWTGIDSDAVIEVPIPTILSRISGSDRVLFAYNRLWIATGASSLEIGDLLEERVDLVNNSIKINSGDGQRIMAMVPFRNNTVIVFKNQSTYMITNATGLIQNASNDLSIENIDNTFGLLAKDTLTHIGNDLWGLSNKGVFSIALNSENNIRLLEIPLSYNIQKTFEQINIPYAHKASAVHYDNYFIVAVPINNSETNNALIVYDLLLKNWIGIWRFRDSNGDLIDNNSDPIFQIRKLIKPRRFNREFLEIIGGTGEVIRFLTNDEKDFVSNASYGLVFSSVTGSTSSVILSNAIANTTLLTQTAGMVHFKFKVTADGEDLAVFSFYELAVAPARLICYLSDGILYVEGYATGGTLNWKIASTSTLLGDRIYQVSIVHDGVSPLLYINNQLDTNVITDTTDENWFSAWPEIDTLRLGYYTYSGGGTNAADMTMYYFGVYEYTGTYSTSGKDDVLFFFPFNEGSGAVLNEEQSRYIIYADGTFVDWEQGTGSIEWENAIKGSKGAGVLWTSRTDSSDIYFDWITSPIFKETESEVQGQNGELRFLHSNPKISLKLHTPNEKNTKALELTDKTYSYTDYEVDHIDWETHNVNLDYDDDFRHNYSPVTLGSGVLLDGGGLCINREVERSERFNIYKTANRFKLQVTNSQGLIAIKSLIGVGEDKGPLKIRSM